MSQQPDIQRCLNREPHEPHDWLFMLTDKKRCPGACACQHERDCDHRIVKVNGHEHHRPPA